MKKMLKFPKLSKVLVFIFLTVSLILPCNVFASTMTTSSSKLSISKVADINVSVNQGDKYALPGTVTAIMSNGSSKTVSVAWNSKVVNTSKVGTVTYSGTVSGYGKQVKLTLTVNPIIKTIQDITVTVNQCDKYTLPKTVMATMSNGSSKSFNVAWNSTVVNTSKVGTVTYSGTVSGYGKKVKLTLTVNPVIKTIQDITVTVNQGDKYALPKTVTAAMSDGSSKTVNVAWNSTAVDTSKVGTVSYSGTVNGYGKKVKLTLTVKSNPNNPIVTFNDKNLEQAIRTEIGKPKGDLLKSDVAQITDLYIDYSGIKDISGINNLTNLQTLSLAGNEISDISSLKGLTKLQTLDLLDNQISDISSLKDLTNLQELELDSNKISDISTLAGLTKLQTLSLSDNQISDISSLRNLTNLQEFELDCNKISDINPLAGLTKLQTLSLLDNQISDISSLKGLTNLQVLLLDDNQVNDISVLENLINLQDLGLSGDKINNISVLKGLTKLQNLNLMDNQISDISPLEGLTDLQTLFLDDNKISDISALKGLTNLQGLMADNNQISDISSLKNLISLQYLSIAENQISDLSPLVGLTNLQALDLWGNQISDISPLKGLTNLQALNIWDNQISDSDQQSLQSALPNCKITFQL